MKKALITLCILAAIGVGIGLWLTAPVRVDPARFATLAPDVAHGAQVFAAAGCASCHKSQSGEDSLALSGGLAFDSDFGTFYAPNISPDPEHGIGGWSLTEFANAVTQGVAPDGSHYYPAFPYTAYTRMTDEDVAALWAYMQTLPPVQTASKPHDVSFPFNIRRSVGGWKWLFMSPDWVQDTPPELERGRYLVEALGHCAECHTPRNALGALDTSRWMAGAPNPSGRGTIPALSPDKLDWSAADIAYYLESGFTPEFDSAGGKMVDVVENYAKLPESDRNAVAAYLKALPAQ